MLLHRLQKDGLIHPPKWLADNTAYLTVMGSTAYGVSNDMSDMDVYGFAFPPKEVIFPHLTGHIPGFGAGPQNFEVWDKHHVVEKGTGKEYDFAIYSIVKFFHLVMENNPNMVDSLFTPERCVIHSTDVSDMVRAERKTFLHKGAYHRFKGYAYQQLKKVRSKRMDEPSLLAVMDFEKDHGIAHTVSMQDIEDVTRPGPGGFVRTTVFRLSDKELAEYKRLYDNMLATNKRLDAVKRFGFDVKFSYHIVRLALECEQILMEGDLDLERNREQLKAIRAGDWTLDRLEGWFVDKEKQLEQVYTDSTLPKFPDENRLRNLLLQCLEHHYGNLESAVVRQTDVDTLIRDMQEVLDRYR
jgi:hypothetical protein